MSQNQTSDVILRQQLNQGAWIAAISFAATFITFVTVFVGGCVLYVKYRQRLEPITSASVSTDVELPTYAVPPHAPDNNC